MQGADKAKNVRIAFADYFLARSSHALQPALKQLGNWETGLVASQLRSIQVSRPVFICGLARSGSTILLELLSQIAGVATHRYRDFPFQAIPWIWNNYLNRFQVNSEPVERPHADRIRITRESPEAMEEPLWMMFFNHLHSTCTSQLLTEATACPEFSRFFDEHLRKMLLIRGGQRYVAKNNYNVGRIAFLARLYPDAQFIVPIRHPVSHVHSLVSQHIRFCEYARIQPRVGAYLQAAGHFEFGPQRIPIQFDSTAANRTLEHWTRGDNHRGYAVQWNEVYGYVQHLFENDQQLAQQIHVVRYEDFCSAPEKVFTNLLQQAGLAETCPLSLDHISAIDSTKTLSAEIQDAIWREVDTVATNLGFTRDE